jgi:anthranilate phosphoribosyltransferase
MAAPALSATIFFAAPFSPHVMVVHSKDGLDEISIADDTYVAEL